MKNNKNVFVLPTDKPSRLHTDLREIFLTPKYQIGKEINSIVESRNIYITSNEEIKEGDWVLDAKFNLVESAKYNHEDLKRDWLKIILTDNKDLIKDGIQAINDEFLEWFVKNPSCEEVEVKKIRFIDKSSEQFESYRYKIIIPKEEPKPHSFCETPEEKCTMNYCDENGCQNRKRELVEPKQETLEEAAERLYPTDYGEKSKNIINIIKQEAFIRGAKWQQEQIGKSEFLQKLRGTLSDAEARRLIFEQFKKK